MIVTTDLSNDERLLLARETMADRYGQRLTSFAYNPSQVRDAFLAGWDAAMEYVEQQRHEWAVESLRLEREHGQG